MPIELLSEKCEGCMSTLSEIHKCSLYVRGERYKNKALIKTIETCPCTMCIVKGMCVVNCGEWISHYVKSETTSMEQHKET